ncbi:CAP domain-containing protein [Virgibacillus siamensis]|uniref:CAP domain-containing protein n=1 Tax=Virgibacillus siamensis TaxID=480071 RepID=UPI0009872CCE|nr:CAP domain-containing protein [Virgibacillus siamensis]
MLNKVVVTTVSAAVLLGGAFQSSADASANIDKSQNQSQPTSDCFQDSSKNLDSLINKYFGDVNWNKVETGQQEQAVPEQETQKQPEGNQQAEQQEKPAEQAEAPAQNQQTEAPAKQEQPEQTSQQQSQNQSQQLSQYEQQVVQLTNKERTERGLSELKVSTELSKVAREKSRDMAENNYFSHNSPTYGSPFDMMKQFGISYRTAGENIAKGQRTPQEVVNAWMNSEGHRKNILNPSFTHIGVGYVENGNIWTQQFIGK